MFIRTMKALAIAGLLLAGAAGVSACSDDDGGGNELTLEEYFEKLEAASDTFTEETDAIAEDLSDTEDLDEIRDGFGKLPALVDDFVGEMEDLNPPEEAQDAHDAAVEAGGEFRDAVDGVLEELEDVDAVEELSEVLDGDEVTSADEAFSAACRDLQDLADDNDIDVNLDCEEE
jgi:hypothetical protein